MSTIQSVWNPFWYMILHPGSLEAAHTAQVFTLIILGVTLIPILLSMRAQKKLSAAQLFRDRWDMFLATWDVEDKEVQRLKEKPHLYMDPMSMYDKYYRGNDDRIRDFLVIVNLYEYFAFTHTLFTRKDFLGRSFPGKCLNWSLQPWQLFKTGLKGIVHRGLYRDEVGYGDLGLDLVKKFVADLD